MSELALEIAKIAAHPMLAEDAALREVAKAAVARVGVEAVAALGVALLMEAAKARGARPPRRYTWRPTMRRRHRAQFCVQS